MTVGSVDTGNIDIVLNDDRNTEKQALRFSRGKGFIPFFRLLYGIRADCDKGFIGGIVFIDPV